MIKKILSFSIILGLFSVNTLAGGTEGDDADVGGTKVKVSRAIASIPDTNDYDADLLEKAKDCAQSIGVLSQLGKNINEIDLQKAIKSKFLITKTSATSNRAPASAQTPDERSSDSCMLYAVHRNDKELLRLVNPNAFDKLYQPKPQIPNQDASGSVLSK